DRPPADDRPRPPRRAVAGAATSGSGRAGRSSLRRRRMRIRCRIGIAVGPPGKPTIEAMSSTGLDRARARMSDAGIDPVAIDTFAHYYRLLEHGETGLIAESSIEPLDTESIDDVEIDDESASAALRTTAVIKLNGGLGTSMGMDRAKSLLC